MLNVTWGAIGVPVRSVYKVAKDESLDRAIDVHWAAIAEQGAQLILNLQGLVSNGDLVLAFRLPVVKCPALLPA
jgi:hypothetical protein